MEDLLTEMRSCKTVGQCMEMATLDSYREHEEIASWLVCIEEMFGHHKKAKVLGQTITLVKFDIYQKTIMAFCRSGKSEVQVTLGSIEFTNLSKNEKLWLKAWNEYII